jgi:hypothetical protein
VSVLDIPHYSQKIETDEQVDSSRRKPRRSISIPLGKEYLLSCVELNEVIHVQEVFVVLLEPLTMDGFRS